MVHVRAIAQRQINLDRCAGSAAHLVWHLWKDLSASHQRIETARIATLPLLGTPAAGEALELFHQMIRVESMIQKAVQTAWSERKERWDHFPGVGCGLRDHPKRSTFPEFSFRTISPNDSIFETASSEYLSAPQMEFRLGITIAKLATEATIEHRRGHEWSVRWTK